MSQNALSRKVNGNGKVILDTHPESDQHQNWTCSTGSPPGPTHQILRRWPQDLAAYGAQVNTQSLYKYCDIFFTLHAKLSGTVYCNRSCLIVYMFVGLLPR